MTFKSALHNLSAEARWIYNKIVKKYPKVKEDPVAHNILRSGLESFDRMRAAQEEVEKYGQVVRDRFEQLRPNPACRLEKDARMVWMAALKQLNIQLDVEPEEETVFNGYEPKAE